MNETIDRDSLLLVLNRETANEDLPAILFLSFLMIVGLVGNILVCIFYGWKSTLTTNSFLIVCLAISDLVPGTMSIPGEIIDLSYPYLYSIDPLCKILTFSNFLSTSASSLILVIIAINRYTIIFKPRSQQMTLLQSKVAALVSFIASLVVSWPVLILYEVNPVNVTNTYNIELTGYQCSPSPNESYKRYQFALNAVYFVMFVLMTVTVSIIYFLIGKKIVKHKGHSKGSNQVPASTVSGTGSIQLQASGYHKRGGNDDNGVFLEEQNKQEQRERDSEDKATGSKELSAVKYTLIMFIITAFFIISFLPYLCLSVLRTTRMTGEEFEDTLVFKILIRFYFLNSALNPVVYGLLNSRFRNYFFSWLPGCGCKRNYFVSHHKESKTDEL